MPAAAADPPTVLVAAVAVALAEIYLAVTAPVHLAAECNVEKQGLSSWSSLQG